MNLLGVAPLPVAVGNEGLRRSPLKNVIIRVVTGILGEKYLSYTPLRAIDDQRADLGSAFFGHNFTGLVGATVLSPLHVLQRAEV